MSFDNKVLWIDDGAEIDLAHLATPVYLDGRYDLVVAKDVSEAIVCLESNEYQAVIIDIRLPPGKDKRWRDIHRYAAGQKIAANLGLELLRSILGATKAKVRLDPRPAWLSPDKIAVLSIESYKAIHEVLEELNIEAFQQKRAILTESALLDLINGICQ